MSEPPIILCDHGEERSGIPQRLRERRCAVDVRALAAGDYLLSAALAVERKAGRDFANSILNRRIYRQLETLAGSYEYAVLLIEDASWEGDRNLPSKLVGELFHWVSYQPNVNIFFSPSAVWSARILHDLAAREQFGKGPTHTPAPAIKRPRTAQEALLGLPGVGPSGAERLLARFVSISGVASASEDELAETVGPKRGAELYRLFNN